MNLYTEYLRVKQVETGHELSISQAQYDFAPDGYEVLDKPATDAGNNPLPAKNKTTVADQAAAKKARTSGGQATNTTEGAQ